MSPSNAGGVHGACGPLRASPWKLTGNSYQVRAGARPFAVGRQIGIKTKLIGVSL